MNTLFFPNAQQFRDTCLPQEYPLPKPIMKYLWSNPSSPEGYQKLIKCCKLFFLKNPILVFKHLEYWWNRWLYCNSDICAEQFACKNEHKRMDMNKRENIKFWFTRNFCYMTAAFEQSNFVSFIRPKLYRYDVKKLVLNCAGITYNNLKLFATGVKVCELYCNNIKYDNGKQGSLEKIIEIFSGAKKVTLYSSPFINDVARCKSYNDFINACQAIEEVKLVDIRNVFDIREFYGHLKRSKNRALFEIETSNDYNEIINEILETTCFEFIPPIIHCDNRAGFEKMKEIQANEAAKYC